MAKPASTTTIGCFKREVPCKYCNVFQLTLPLGLGKADLKILDKIIRRRRMIKRGEYLFRSGDPFLFVHAVKYGSFKAFTTLEDGSQQTTGFILPGELLSLEAVNSGTHQYSATALETSSVCEVPFHRLEELGDVIPSVQRQMLRVMSKQILHDQSQHMVLGKNTAEERLAAFLLSLSNRYEQRGFSAIEFHLSMTRADIADYLGLALETVSRLFTRFRTEGLISVQRKHVHLRDLDRLKTVAALQDKHHASSQQAS